MCRLWKMELFKYMKVFQATMAHVARCRHHTVATRHLQAHLGTSLTKTLSWCPVLACFAKIIQPTFATLQQRTTFISNKALLIVYWLAVAPSLSTCFPSAATPTLPLSVSPFHFACYTYLPPPYQPPWAPFQSITPSRPATQCPQPRR